jgi:hypothetical protein
MRVFRARGLLPSLRSWWTADAQSLHPVVHGLLVSTALLTLYLIWESAFGHLGYAADHAFTSPEMVLPRIALTVILLTGFTVGAAAYSRRENIREAEALAALLPDSFKEHRALVDRLQYATESRAWVGSVAAILLGLFLVTGKNPWQPYLLSREPWNHDSVWFLASNILLFAVLGRQFVGTFETNAIFAQLEAHLPRVDLLHPERLARFGRRGLRSAFLWIGGSSIASIVFVNQQFSWLTGLVLTATVSVGTIAFLLPLRGLHRRIREEKEAELERVRAAIHRNREALLSTASEADAPSTQMPGLLAYEHRITSVHEWPINTPEVVRFGLLILLGLGSWLGGALVGHVVDFLLR